MTAFWQKGINKEMYQVKVELNVTQGNKTSQDRKDEVFEALGYQEIRYHLIFDV